MSNDTIKEVINDTVDLATSSEKNTGKKIGIVLNKKSVLAWNYDDDLDIRVVGNITAPNEMDVYAYENGKIVFHGTALCSRWTACKIIRYIRNGLVSNRMKRRHSKAARAARKAAALNPVNPVNPV